MGGLEPLGGGGAVKRYRFRLERVERVRKIEEDLAEARLAAGLHALAASAEAERVERGRYADVSWAGAGVVEPWLASHADKERAGARVALAEASRRAMEIEAAALRQAWQAAARAVTALERLDERRRAEHAVAEGREEQAVLDEVSVSAQRRAGGHA